MATKSNTKQSAGPPVEPPVQPPVRMAQKQASLLVDHAKAFVAANGRSTKARATLATNVKALAAALGRLTPKLEAAAEQVGETTKPPKALSDATKKTKAAARKALTSASTAARQQADAHQAYRALEPLVASITAELDRAAKAARVVLPGQRVKTPDASPKRAAWQSAERASTKPVSGSAALTVEAATKVVAKAPTAVGKANDAAAKVVAAVGEATKAGAAAQKAIAALTAKLPAAMKAASTVPEGTPKTTSARVARSRLDSYKQPREVAALDAPAKAAAAALAKADRALAGLERQMTTLDAALGALDVALSDAVRATTAAARAAARPAPQQPAAKPPAKKPAKKPAAQKPAAKKPAANKSAAKQPAAQKQAAKQPAGKSASAKKPAAKKAAAKRAPKVHLTSTGVEIDGKVPRFDKRYLTKQQNKLLTMREKLTDHLEHLEQEDEEIRLSHELGDTQFSEESGEGDSSSVEHDNIKYISALEQDNLVQIEGALERIKDGTYGYSLASGRPIPVIRLDAIPEATLRADEKSSGGSWN